MILLQNNKNIREKQQEREAVSFKRLPSLVNLYWQRFALPYVPHTVPSTLTGLTARFGMDLGVSLLHLPPIIIFPEKHSQLLKTSMKTRTIIQSLVPVSSILHSTYTSGLSNQSSTGHFSLALGYLILEGVSHLDAFSGYLCRT